MAFLKKTTIKRITKKRAAQLWGGLVETLNDHPNIEPKNALIKYIEDAFRLGTSFISKSYSLASFYGLLRIAKKDKEIQWDTLFTLLTAKLVFEELSYDPSIGTQEDLRIVSDITYDLLRNWTSSARV